MGGKNNDFLYYYFNLFCRKKKKKKPKGYVILEFVWGYFDMLKIEDETEDFSY